MLCRKVSKFIVVSKRNVKRNFVLSLNTGEIIANYKKHIRTTSQLITPGFAVIYLDSESNVVGAAGREGLEYGRSATTDLLAIQLQSDVFVFSICDLLCM